METSSELTGEQLNLWTSSAEDTPANHSAPQASDEEKTTLDTYGHGSETPLAHYDPDTRSWRTLGDISLWGEQPSLENLPKSGMTQNGVLYRQPAWEPPIDATGSSSWPTPTALTRPMEGNVRLYRAKIKAGEMTEQEAEAILGKSVWEAQGKVPAIWPTPRSSSAMAEDLNNVAERMANGAPYKAKLEQAVAMWPTPTTQENEHPNAIYNEKGRRVSPGGSTHSMNLADTVKALEPAQSIGKLNPQWVEWLMGFPVGWTDLED